MPSDSASPSQVTHACNVGPLISIVTQNRGYYSLNTDCVRLVDIRKEKEQRAVRHWKAAILMTAIIRRFPFVRAVFVSGELSKGIASKNGDVDYVVVTANERLWICRTLLILFKKIFLLNSKKYFCLNHFITEHNLEVHEKNVYTALEIGTLKPLYNARLFYRYLDANPWVSSFLPNVWPTNGVDKRFRQSIVQRIFESLFPNAFASKLDARLLEFWKRVWKKRYPNFSNEKRSTIFRSTPDLSTAYHGDFAGTILTKYQERLRQFGLDG